MAEGKRANAVTVNRGANAYDEWVEGTLNLPLIHLVNNQNNQVRMLNHRVVTDLQALTHEILPNINADKYRHARQGVLHTSPMTTLLSEFNRCDWLHRCKLHLTGAGYASHGSGR